MKFSRGWHEAVCMIKLTSCARFMAICCISSKKTEVRVFSVSHYPSQSCTDLAETRLVPLEPCSLKVPVSEGGESVRMLKHAPAGP